MRKASSGGFVASLLLNLALNVLFCIPAIVLLVLHFVLDISIWWSIALFVAWLLYVLIATLLLCFVSKVSNEEKPTRENKNPYSAKNSDVFPSSTDSDDETK